MPAKPKHPPMPAGPGRPPGDRRVPISLKLQPEVLEMIDRYAAVMAGGNRTAGIELMARAATAGLAVAAAPTTR